jgi:hypothetical protein
MSDENYDAIDGFGITLEYSTVGADVWTEIGAILGFTPPRGSSSPVKYPILNDPLRQELAIPGKRAANDFRLTVVYLSSRRALLESLRDQVKDFRFTYPDGSTLTGAAFITEVGEDEFTDTKEVATSITVQSSGGFTYAAGDGSLSLPLELTLAAGVATVDLTAVPDTGEDFDASGRKLTKLRITNHGTSDLTVDVGVSNGYDYTVGGGTLTIGIGDSQEFVFSASVAVDGTHKTLDAGSVDADGTSTWELTFGPEA